MDIIKKGLFLGRQRLFILAAESSYFSFQPAMTTPGLVRKRRRNEMARGKKIRVAVLFGGKSAEHEVSLLSARNVDALARAKHLAMRAGNKKVMLLLPRLDLIDEREDEELLVELDALIETTSELPHTLVVGTTNKLVSGSEIDYLFGVTLTLPGAPVAPVPMQPLQSDVHRMLAGVTEFYLDRAIKAGYRLADISREGFIARVLLNVTNPAQIEDIVVLCQTAAIYRQRMGGKGTERVITPDMLELTMRRVVIGG